MRARLEIEGVRRALLGIYREKSPSSPRDYAAAAEQAGCSTRTARRAWEVGWPGLRALRDEVAEEQLLARAARSREALQAKVEEATIAAKFDAVQSRAQAGRMLEYLRRSTMGSLAGLLALPRYIQALGQRIASEDPNQMTPEQARAAYASIAKTLQRLIAATRDVQELENLVLGEPTEIIQADLTLHAGLPEQVTLEEAEAEVEAARRALERAKLLEGDSDAVSGSDAA